MYRYKPDNIGKDVITVEEFSYESQYQIPTKRNLVMIDPRFTLKAAAQEYDPFQTKYRRNNSLL